MQSMGQVKAELDAERSKAAATAGEVELVRLTRASASATSRSGHSSHPFFARAAPAMQLKKQLGELLAAKEEVGVVTARLSVPTAGQAMPCNHAMQMTATQAEACERFVKERAELEARVREQERLVEEQRRQAAQSAEQERSIADALAKAEEARKAAMEAADKVVSLHNVDPSGRRCSHRIPPNAAAPPLQRAAELEELATQVQAKDEALSRLDKEHGANLLK